MKQIKISEEMKKSLSLLEYTEWSEIQKEVIPLLMEKHNVVACSKTGSGKTCAFALPICENIVWEEKYPQALILTCTRELAMQIKEECSLLGKYKKIKVQCVYGKENIENQKAALKQQCHILVATPGRLLDLLQQDSVVLKNVKTIILDEADYMLDLGFLADVEKIIEEVRGAQIALFSATLPERIKVLIKEKIQNPQFVHLEEKAQINHYFMQSENAYMSLLELIKTIDIESAIVFCERREEVESIYKKLKEEQIPCARIHGDLMQKERFVQLDLFKKGQVRILVASDVAARGIDVNKVSHVFHYGNINHKETYIHRSGRSGRVQEKGVSILLVEKWNPFYEELLEEFHMQDMNLYENKGENLVFESVTKKDKTEEFNKVIERLYISAGSEKKIATRDIIGAFCSIDEIEMEDIGVIEILRRMSYVEIYNHKAQIIVEAMKDKTIKKKKVKVEIAK